MRRFAIGTMVIMFFITFFITAPICCDAYRVHVLRKRARTISVGDTKQRVQQLMGNPSACFMPGSFLIFFPAHETWAYGAVLDLSDPLSSDFPYFFPFTFRIFGPDSDDVEVEFDSLGRVVSVSVSD